METAREETDESTSQGAAGVAAEASGTGNRNTLPGAVKRANRHQTLELWQ